MKYALDTNIFIDGFRSEEAQAEVFAFKRLVPFVKGFRYTAPWPIAADALR